jgi:cytoskeleton protein RodZ
MNTTELVEEHIVEPIYEELPGAKLAAVRDELNLTKEYVAGKLHLRVAVIEQLEADDYEHMPEPVFIKGYLRAYAKLVEIDEAPLLATFNRIYKPQPKQDRTLWQTKRPSHFAENAVKWITGAVAIGVIVAVSLWWHKNKDNEPLFSNAAVTNHNESEVRLTDLSKMRSLLSSKTQFTLEKSGE